MTPFFLNLHPMTPLFSTYVSNFTYKLQIFARFVRILRNLQICSKFNIKFANFGLKLHFCALNDPQFGSPHRKRSHFLGAHTEWTHFCNKILHWMPLLSFSGRHLYVTFIFKCPRPRDLPPVYGYIVRVSPTCKHQMYISVLFCNQQQLLNIYYNSHDNSVIFCLSYSWRWANSDIKFPLAALGETSVLVGSTTKSFWKLCQIKATALVQPLSNNNSEIQCIYQGYSTVEEIQD